LDALTSPDGALRLAIAALLAVVGHRLARPARGADWLGFLAYAGALAALYLAERAAAPAPPVDVAVRGAGALLLVGGLVLAGAPARAARRALPAGVRPPPAEPLAARGRRLVHAGLALVLAGQLLRAPTPRGAAAVLVAAVLLAATAGISRRPGGP
jgi:hypothetical protein